MIYMLLIRASVASADEGEETIQWPPELVALQRQFATKYQRQLAQLVQEHALEIADIKADYDAKLSALVKEYSIKEAEEMPLEVLSTGDMELDKIIRERDNLRSLALTLRQVVCELARYLTTCEDELNKSIVGELLKLAAPCNGHQMQVNVVESESSDSEGERPHLAQKRVHFAPDVSSLVSLMDDDYLLDCLETSMDVSVHLRSELQSCLERLRMEAATVLGLTQMREKALPTTVEDRRLTSLTRQLIEEKKAKDEANMLVQSLKEELHKYEKEVNDLQKELADTKERIIKVQIAEEAEYKKQNAESRTQNLHRLQERAHALLSEKGDCPPVWLGLIEELCMEGDALVEEAWRARDELQLEVEAADKQLRSTRAFLEEQASEREQERDESGKEISRLTDLLRERERDWTSHKKFATEVAAVEQRLNETTDLLKETEEKKEKVEKELKAAVDKIWVLRDIISELEVQVSTRCEHEQSLEHRVAELEVELDSQIRSQAEMLQELQTLKDRRDKDLLIEHSGLQDQISNNSSPRVIRQIKSQLNVMARSMEKHIKELEAVNIHVSSASLSSPSEDISIREQLEALRCGTPEDKSSCNSSPPSPLVVEEVNQLNDKLLRYSRAGENIIKKLRDRDMEIIILRTQNDELQTERDVLQGQSERQLMQLASLHKKVEELRVRSERDMQISAAPLHERILNLEKQVASSTNELHDSQRKIVKMKQKLDRSEAIVQSQEAELSSLSEHQQELVYKLQQDLATMKVEKQQLQDMVEKYRTQDNISFPRLIEVMLAEKNADIDQLQERVEELQSQQEHFVAKSQNQQAKTRSHRVSFADDIAHFELGEGDKARDFQHHDSSIRPLYSTPLISVEENGSSIVQRRAIGEDISKISEPADFNLTSSPNRAIQLENVLSQLKAELEEKNQRLVECETQLQELPALEQELTKAKEELVETVRVVSEDKQFYEEQLKTLSQTKDLLAQREEELTAVRAELDQKEEDIVRTKADLTALHIIMDGLQQKLKEAKTFAENHEVISTNNQVQELRLSSEKYKEECDTQKIRISDLEKQILQLNDTLKESQEGQKVLNETIEKLEKDKQNILSELVMTKSKCKSLQEELEKALENATENSLKIQSLCSDLEASEKENKKLSVNCQRLKKEMELLTKKQKTELKNVLKKDTQEALKVKEELESLKSTNSELQSECEKLREELHELESSLELLKEMSNKDDKIQQLEAELKQLDEDNKTLRGEKNNIEQSLNMEISELKVLIDDLNKNIVALETESKESQDIIQERQQKENLIRRYESLKREYERQRRARRENEKKCFVLKSELAKEKQFTARLQNGAIEKRVPQLTVTKATIVDITSEGTRLANSLENLTHEVQKELNASAQLDQSLISGLQQNADSTEVPRSSSMPPRVDYLTERLAEVETALHVEKVVVSELRARLTEERARYLEERARTHDLCQELATLQTLNDQFEDKFKNIVHQLEYQVNEVKQLKKNGMSADENAKELQRLKKLLEESDKRVDKLLEERVFNKNQLLYLREELAKVLSERDLQTTEHDHECKATAVEEVLQTLESRTRELEEEQQRCTMLQQMLDQATQEHSQQLVQAEKLHLQVEEDLKRQLKEESELRRSLEAQIKSMELAERTRNSRRRIAEVKLKELVTQGEKTKKELERECLALQRKLKHSNLQLTAHTAESPLSLRLAEANMAVERLVGEKEDLNSANLLLKNEKESLEKRLKEHDMLIDELKTRIHMLNIKVTDGGMDNLNSMFAAERAAWLKEKETLKLALAQAQAGNTDSFNSYRNSAHILQRYLRAESHRNALVWQKRYLLITLRGYQDEERHTVAALWRFPSPAPPPAPSPETKFRIAVYAVRAVSRLQFLVEHRKRSYENTCRILQHALNNTKFVPHRAGKIPELHTLWKKSEATSSSSTVHPGSISQYLDDINTIQDRIKNTLSTAS